MLTAFLILIMVVMYTAQSLFCRLYSSRYPGKYNLSSTVFSIVVGAVIAVCGFAVCKFSFTPAPLTWLFGILNAAVLLGYNFCMIGASTKGPYSVQMVCMLSGGILIPAFVSLFFGDRLSWVQWIAVAVIIVANALVSRKKDDQRASGKLFYLLCIGLFLFNGAYGALLDVQQRITGTGDKEEMVILTYLLAALVSAAFLACKRRHRFLGDFKQSKASLAFLLICAAVSTLAIYLLVYIIPLVNITLLYTFDNAGVLLLSVLCSCVLFREKLSVQNVIGCVMMTAGLIAMSLF